MGRNGPAATTRSCCATPSAGASSPSAATGSGSRRCRRHRGRPDRCAVGARDDAGALPAQLGRLDDARRRLDAIVPTLPAMPARLGVARVARAGRRGDRLVGTHSVSTWVYDALLPYVEALRRRGHRRRGPGAGGLLPRAARARPGAPRCRHHFGPRWTLSRRSARPSSPPASRRTQLRPPRHRHRHRRSERVPPRGRALGAALRRKRGGLPDAKGLHDLAPARRGAGSRDRRPRSHRCPGRRRPGAVLDPAARDAYRRRLQELEADIDDAGARGRLVGRSASRPSATRWSSSSPPRSGSAGEPGGRVAGGTGSHDGDGAHPARDPSHRGRRPRARPSPRPPRPHRHVLCVRARWTGLLDGVRPISQRATGPTPPG